MIAAYPTRIEIKDYSKVGLVKRIREKGGSWMGMYSTYLKKM